MMLFTTYLDQVRADEPSVIIDSAWGQGRAVFGGLVAALLYQAMLREIDDHRPVRSLQISFVGPVEVDKPFELKTELLRQGKSVTQVIGRGVQDGQTLVTIIGSFGHGRDSAVQVKPPVSVVPALDQTNRLPYIDGVTPKFTKFFDFRFVTQFPFTGSKESVMKGLVKFKDASAFMDNSVLLGLVDAWPPVPLSMMSRPAPASSLNWSIDFISQAPALRVDEYSYYEAEIVHSENGYAFTRAKITNTKGELIAISQQTVTIFG